MVRIVTGLLVAVLILCGCWGEPPPRPPSVPSTRPRPSVPTTRPVPGKEVVGSCLTSPSSQTKGVVRGEFIRCGLKPRPGFRSRGRVVGVTPMLIDTVGAPPFGPYCPPATDAVVGAQLPSGKTTLLCLNTVPRYGNAERTRSTR